MDDWTCVILGAGGGEMICHDDADNCYDVVAEVEMDVGFLSYGDWELR